jgi:hypothetical protein
LVPHFQAILDRFVGREGKKQAQELRFLPFRGLSHFELS